MAGAAYRLEGTDDLAAGHWTILIERLEGTGERLKFLDPGAAGYPKYFYRIIRLP